MLPAFDWNGGRLQLEFLAGIVGIRSGAPCAEKSAPLPSVDLTSVRVLMVVARLKRAAPRK